MSRNPIATSESGVESREPIDIARAMSGNWSDIETFDAHGQNNPAIVAVTDANRSDIVGEAWRHEDGEWWWAGTGPGDYYDNPISEIQYGHVTHWMPLPLGPTVTPRKSSRRNSPMTSHSPEVMQMAGMIADEIVPPCKGSAVVHASFRDVAYRAAALAIVQTTEAAAHWMTHDLDDWPDYVAPSDLAECLRTFSHLPTVAGEAK